MTPEWQPWGDEAWNQAHREESSGIAVLGVVCLASLLFAGGVVTLIALSIRGILRHVAGGL